MFNLLFLLIGIGAGIAVAYYFLKKSIFNRPTTTQMNAKVVLDKIERVFKIVTAEGHFSEVFDYSQTSHLGGFIPSTKKALLIVNAKVLMGYDFKKIKFEVDTIERKVRILEFPKPEVLSLEPDIRYYNIENGLFNKFDNEDLTQLQEDAKQKILAKVDSSDLPTIAAKQINQLLTEIGSIQNWELIGEGGVKPQLQLK